METCDEGCNLKYLRGWGGEEINILGDMCEMGMQHLLICQFECVRGHKLHLADVNKCEYVWGGCLPVDLPV